MARYQGWFALVLALAIAAGMFLVRTPLELGLDLRGGSQLTVEVKPAGKVTRVGAEEMEAVMTGNKSGQEAADAAVERGNQLLRDFESANQ